MSENDVDKGRRLERAAIVRIVRKELRFYGATKGIPEDERDRAVYVCDCILQALGWRRDDQKRAALPKPRRRP